jgi:Activator of Hsp90 ATPase homolog 1-like protein
VDVCEPPRRLLVTSKEADAPDEEVMEATLTADGGQTILVLDQRGLPLDQLAAYGAGLQVHVEDLAAYITGRDRAAEARWGELLPAYQDLAADIG